MLCFIGPLWFRGRASILLLEGCWFNYPWSACSSVHGQDFCNSFVDIRMSNQPVHVFCFVFACLPLKTGEKMQIDYIIEWWGELWELLSSIDRMWLFMNEIMICSDPFMFSHTGRLPSSISDVSSGGSPEFIEVMSKWNAPWVTLQISLSLNIVGSQLHETKTFRHFNLNILIFCSSSNLITLKVLSGFWQGKMHYWEQLDLWGRRP